MLNLSSVANWLGEKLEDKDGFVPKTMLCLPIFNGQRDVIGVAQLINKVFDSIQIPTPNTKYSNPLDSFVRNIQIHNLVKLKPPKN